MLIKYRSQRQFAHVYKCLYKMLVYFNYGKIHACGTLAMRVHYINLKFGTEHITWWSACYHLTDGICSDETIHMRRAAFRSEMLLDSTPDSLPGYAQKHEINL